MNWPWLPLRSPGESVTINMYGILKAKSKGKSGQQLELGGIAILKCCTLDQPLEVKRERERGSGSYI